MITRLHLHAREGRMRIEKTNRLRYFACVSYDIQYHFADEAGNPIPGEIELDRVDNPKDTAGNDRIQLIGGNDRINLVGSGIFLKITNDAQDTTRLRHFGNAGFDLPMIADCDRVNISIKSNACVKSMHGVVAWCRESAG